MMFESGWACSEKHVTAGYSAGICTTCGEETKPAVIKCSGNVPRSYEFHKWATRSQALMIIAETHPTLLFIQSPDRIESSPIVKPAPWITTLNQ